MGAALARHAMCESAFRGLGNTVMDFRFNGEVATEAATVSVECLRNNNNNNNNNNNRLDTNNPFQKLQLF